MGRRVFRALAEGRQQLVVAAQEVDAGRRPPARWRRCSTTSPCDRRRGRRSSAKTPPASMRDQGQRGAPARRRKRGRGARAARGGDGPAPRRSPTRARRPRMAAHRHERGPQRSSWSRLRAAAIATPADRARARGATARGPRTAARRKPAVTTTQSTRSPRDGSASGGGTVTGGVYRRRRRGPSARRVIDSPAYVRPPGPPGFLLLPLAACGGGGSPTGPGPEPVGGRVPVGHGRRLLRRERQRHAGRRRSRRACRTWR